MEQTIGLINCSGACYPAILAKLSCNKTAIRNKSDFTEICFTEHATALLSCDPKAIEASQKSLGKFENIISVSGCGACCSTKLLNMYGITPLDLRVAEDLGIEILTPPFKMEQIQKLNDRLEEAVELIVETAKCCDKEAVPV